MFEALFRKACCDRALDVIAESAGVRKEYADGHPADEKAIVCMDRFGIDIRGHRSRWIGSLDLGSYDLIVCCGRTALNIVQSQVQDRSKVVLTNSPEGVHDPFGEPQEAFNDCANIIAETIIPQIIEMLF
jgi:protein-tyrosine-phosphatase